MRVSAANECGVGEPSMNSDKFIPQEPTSEVMNFACDEVDDNSGMIRESLSIRGVSTRALSALRKYNYYTIIL